MNILEEFWYGNLDPAEYDASPSEEYRELIRQISQNDAGNYGRMNMNMQQRPPIM